MTLLVGMNSYAFDFKKFFKEDLKYNANLGFGKVSIKEDNSFDSDLTFTYINYGGGASYALNSKYTLSANVVFKNFTELEYSQANKSGTVSVNSTYSDLYFAVARNWKSFILSAGYDNLNYFVGAKESIIEPVRIDRATVKATWTKFSDKFFYPSAKVGIFLPVIEDVSGFDISVSGKYVLPKYNKVSFELYYYKALLNALDNDSDTSSYGITTAYEF